MANNLKTKEDIEKIRKGGGILAGILQRTIALVKPGISTWQLNDFAEKEIYAAGGRPSFKGHGPKNNPFPAGLCTSINSEVVHGIPSKKRILQEGDIIGLDIGMEYLGRYTDHAITVAVGKIDKQAQKLLEVTRESMFLAIKQAKVGNKVGDIADATQQYIEKNGFNVVRDLVGHGVGFAVWEDPQVPGFGKPNTGVTLQEGMVLAIEPMATIGDYRLIVENDDWTISTADGSLAAHFEHTVAITRHGPEILTVQS